MKAHAVFVCLAFAILFSGVGSATFTIKNNCPFTVWPGTLTGAGKPQLSTTGFELATGASQTVDAPPGWSSRFWARTQCTNDKTTRKLTCATGDCASGQVGCGGAGAILPASLVELTIAENGGLDFYDISLVDGFNLPVSLSPQGGTGSCQTTSCPRNVNAVCPPELAVRAGDGSVVACMSACLAVHQPRYCCTGDYGTPATCPPTDLSMLFKTQCPQAYSYAYDDKTSTFTCSGGPNYLITFCP